MKCTPPTPWAKLLVFGAPGHGKTYSSVLGADACIALEPQGLPSACSANADLKLVVPQAGNAEWSAFWRGLPAKLAGHNVVVVDSLTEIHCRNLAAVAAHRVGGRAVETAAKAQPHEKIIFENKLDLTEQDYGRAHRWTARQIQILEALPAHVIAIAHSRVSHSSGGLKVSPYIGAKKINDAFHLHRHFSAVGLLHCDGAGVRSVRWTSSRVKVNGKDVQVDGKGTAVLQPETSADSRVWLEGFTSLIERMEAQA